MKRIGYTLVLGILAVLLSSNQMMSQGTQPAKVTDEKQKQKEAELLKKQQALQEEELRKLKEAQYDAQKDLVSEKEMQRKIAEIEAGEAAKEYDNQLKYRVVRSGDDMSRVRPMIVIPDEEVYNYAVPYLNDYYLSYDIGHSEKPGSSWNYSRQVLESTFTNEFTMDAGGEDGNVSLAVSGNCAEGSINVAIIMPDGKKLSEVVIDANGSLNWRKSFDDGEGEGWKNGKWIFRIAAREATGNFRISMTSN